QKDFSNINVTWNKLDCVAYTHSGAIINIATSVHKIFNKLFHPPCYENIRAELESARSNNLPTAIKGYCEWDNNAISYKIDESPAVITFIEVENQKRLSARYLLRRNCKRIRNKVRVEALVIKEMDFNAIATSQKLSPKEAEIVKFDQEHSIANTMVLKHFICEIFMVVKMHGYDEENAMEELKAKDITQWEITCYKAKMNLKKSVIEDLHKSYSANY
ncbi:18969_t:CDS:2, partial [Funneliformis geosporum]